MIVKKGLILMSKKTNNYKTNQKQEQAMKSATPDTHYLY